MAAEGGASFHFNNPFQSLLPDHIRYSASLELGRVKQGMHAGSRGVIICGSGPSLLKFSVLDEIRKKARQGWTIVACKEAIRLLRDRKVPVHYSVSMDPTPWQVAKTHIDKDITYCIASSCHPELYRHVLDNRCHALVFHSACGARCEWEGLDELGLYKKHHGTAATIMGGYTCANRALGLANFMGFPPSTTWLAGVDFGWRDTSEYYAKGAVGKAGNTVEGRNLDMQDHGQVDGRNWNTRIDMLASAVDVAKRFKRGQIGRWLGDSLGKSLAKREFAFIDQIIEKAP